MNIPVPPNTIFIRKRADLFRPLLRCSALLRHVFFNSASFTALSVLNLVLLLGLSTLSVAANSEDKIELDTTIIKGNSELPKILYVVPWQDISENKQATQKLTLHSLFGDLFEPYVPPSPEITSQDFTSVKSVSD